MIAYSSPASSRAGRTAGNVRRSRTHRARRRTIVVILGTLCVATFAVLSYLMLMSGVYRLNYEMHSLTKQRAGLLEDVTRLDDRIAELESRDRLAVIADGLGMRDPRRFAVATVPPRSVPRPRGLAFLPLASNWLH